MDERLLNLGITDSYVQEAARYDGLFLGRVVTQHKDLYKVASLKGEVVAEISGRLRYNPDADPAGYPAVGDFVMIDRTDNETGHAIIQHVLTRKSIFLRKAAGTKNIVQVIVANIDTVFICMSLNNDFNLRRLERYLSIAWSSGAIPVLVLTKSDLCEDINDKLSEVEAIAPGVDVLVTSSMQDGYKSLLKYITNGQTVAFIGSSGVGKSTLINRLLGGEYIQTAEIRKDDKGRHITTRRELFMIPTGGAVIDTPGMRELGVENVDLSKSFSEIDELADSCRFKDCQHESEPGCAVRKAVEDGIISDDRLKSYKKLKKEAKYDGLSYRQIEKEKINTMFSGFGGMKNARNFIKIKNKDK